MRSARGEEEQLKAGDHVGRLAVRLLAVGCILVVPLLADSVDPDVYDVLFLKNEGAGANFADSSTANTKTVTAHGNATQLTCKFNRTAGFFNGTTDYVVVPDSPDWDFGTGDFTIEMWVNFTKIPPAAAMTLVSRDNDSDFRVSLFTAGPTLEVNLEGGGAFSAAWTPAINTWYHIAVTRNGTDLRVFIDGSQLGTTQSNSADVTGTAPLYIGREITNGRPLHGWLKELRISDSARYTANFTPASAPHSSDANTKLLLHFDSPAESPLGPAIYFDGSGDYLTVPDSADWDFGSSDFTIEFWFRTEVTGGFGYCGRDTSTIRIFNESTDYIRVNANGGALDIGTGAGSVAANRWQHYALVRAGDTFRTYLDGLPKETRTYAPAINDGANPFLVGYIGSGSTFQGSMREFRISSSARYAAEGFNPSQTGFTLDANTKLYIKGDGNNGATNFVDQTGKTVTTVGDTVTRYTEDYRACIFKDDSTTGHHPYPQGSAKVDFFAACGSSVASFDGSGDSVTVPDSADWDIGLEDWTVEFSVRQSPIPAVAHFLDMGSYGNNNGIGVQYVAASRRLYALINGTEYTTTLEKEFLGDTWYHVAISRSGDTLRSFVNGEELGGFTDTTDIDAGSHGLTVGRTSVDTYDISGRLDNLRISRGIARYTADFNPPIDMPPYYIPRDDSSAPLFRPGDIPDGLVGYWRLNEASGTRMDASGNGNHLADSNTVGCVTNDYWSTGERCADFNRSGTEYLSIADASANGLALTGSVSVSAFVKLEGTPFGQQFIVAKSANGNANGFALYVEDNPPANGLKAELNGEIWSSDFSLSVSKWHHVGFVYDGAAVSFHVDGNLVKTVAHSTDMVPNSSRFTVGWDDGTNPNLLYDGLLKDIAVWNRALTPLEVKSLAMGVDLGRHAFRPDSVSVPPTAWWKLNETGGDRADSSGNGHTLTDVNTVGASGGFVAGVSADFEFDNNEYLTASDSEDFDLSGGVWSLSVWLKPETTAGNHSFFSHRTSNADYCRADIRDGALHFYVVAGSVTRVHVQSNPILSVGNWCHVVCRENGDEWRVFLDGRDVTVSGGDDSDRPLNYTDAVRIGVEKDGDQKFDGCMSDYAIWNGYALTEHEIDSLACGLPVQQQGIVSYWPCDGGSGDLVDAVGSNTLTEISDNSIASTNGLVGRGRHVSPADHEHFAISDGAQTGLEPPAFTAVGWMNPVPGRDGGFMRKHGADDQWRIKYKDSTAVIELTADIGDQKPSPSPTVPCTAGQFNHLALVYDGANLDLYSGGVKGATDSTCSGPFLGNDNDFEIGKSSADASYDELSFWARPLREEEIKSLHNRGLNGWGLFADPLDVGLVAYYPLDGNANDASGNGNHGAELGGLSFAPGKVGRSALFDGTDDYIQVPHSDSLNVTGHLTVAAWVKLDVLDNGDGPRECQPIVSKYHVAASNRAFRLTYNDAPLARHSFVYTVSASNSTFSGGVAASETMTETGRWHHISAVFVPTEAMRLYLDGVDITGGLAAGAIPAAIATNALPVLLGRDQDETGWLNGTLDEVRIYNRALSSNEVAQLYERTAYPGMVKIPAGEFAMGDAFGEGDADELPVHTNFISAFYIDRFEVTKALWDDVHAWAMNNGYTFDNAGAGKATNHPVHSVNWYDCVKWCNARSEKEGRVPAYYTSVSKTNVYRTGQVNVSNNWVRWSSGHRLLTEAEWERAARGGVAGTRFAWADTDGILHSRANYRANGGQAYDLSNGEDYHGDYDVGEQPFTSPVGAFPANGFGLYDMVGNVWEWCWDWNDDAYYSHSPLTDPRGPASSEFRRQLRGGAWSYDASFCRVAFRGFYPPTNTDPFIGFRTALPALEDTDGDGMDDAWERAHFGNLSRDGTGDYDGDGRTDADEFVDGTDPTDAGSTLGLVAYYPFNGNANDASGNGHHGSLGGDARWSSSGVEGGSVELDGSQDHVRVDDADGLDSPATSDFTLSAWVWTGAAARSHPLLYKHEFGTDNDGSWSFGIAGTDKLQFVQFPPGDDTILYGDSAVPTGEWTHVAVAYSRTSSILRFYCNGTADGTHSLTLNISNTARPLYIGAEKSAPLDRDFRGHVDEVRIYDRALSPDEVVQLYERTAYPGMVRIPAGAFEMGDHYNVLPGENDMPVHSVYVSEFRIGRFEVSRGQWEDTRLWAVTNGYSDLPVVDAAGGMAVFPAPDLGWYDCVKWCNARSEREGLTPVYFTGTNHVNVYRSGTVDVDVAWVDWQSDGYRLPTEAEWEKAARGGLEGHHFPWPSLGGTYSNHIDGSKANYLRSGDPFEDSSTPVGYYNGDQIPSGVDMANGYGLYDAAGNSHEWCWDWYEPLWYADPAAAADNTRGPASSSDSSRVYRDGSNKRSPLNLRCAWRAGSNPTWLWNGDFRVVRGALPATRTLVIDGSTVAAGSPSPHGYGTNYIASGRTVTNSVTSPADESNGVRWVCTGWTGTGSVPASGVGTQCVFTITNDSTLTWQWVERRTTIVRPSPQDWYRETSGAWEETAEGLRAYSFGYREHGRVYTRKLFDFLDSETFVKWKVDGNGDYLTAGPQIWYLVAPTDFSTDRVFGGTKLIADNTWYYTRMRIQADGNWTVVTTTGDYDVSGGSAFDSRSSALDARGMELIRAAVLQMHVNDTYGGADANLTVGELRTDATELLVAPTGVSYDFEDQLVPAAITTTGSVAVDNFGSESDYALKLGLNSTISLVTTNVAAMRFDAHGHDFVRSAMPQVRVDGLARLPAPSANGMWLPQMLPIAPSGVHTVEVVTGSAGMTGWSIDNMVFYRVADVADVRLDVTSAYGLPEPGVGAHAYATGTVVTCSTPRVEDMGTTQAVCTGWAGTGSVPASGDTNVCVFTITNASTLAWQWREEFFLDVETSGSGTVDVADGWYTNGAEVVVSAMPALGYAFAGWTGDVPPGEADNASITVVMDLARAITAEFTPGGPSRVAHVDAGATGANDGTTWEDAFTNLQDAIAAAVGSNQIWVAAGTYVPGSDRLDTFLLGEPVGLYGGFAGTETNRNERDWQSNVTILSGDVNGDDVGFSNNTDNVDHVVVVSNNATVSGFTIAGGRTDAGAAIKGGGGMLVWGFSPLVSDCTFTRNVALNAGGGGVFCRGTSAPIITNCTFADNHANFGGGIRIDHSATATVTRCIFSSNVATTGGGGARTVGSSSSVFSHCRFVGNSAVAGGGYGGGMNIGGSSDATILNCLFSGNRGASGGALYNQNAIAVSNCTFSLNSASRGGAFLNYLGVSPRIVNCVLWGNTASSSGNQIYNDIATPVLGYCDVEGGIGGIVNVGGASVTDGGGNIGSDPLFADADGPDDVAGTDDDDLHLRSTGGRWTASGWTNDTATSPCIDAGDPAGDWALEPLPNGGRVNMGAYGNTPEASKTPLPATFVVAGHPDEHDTPVSHGYGTNTVAAGTLITNSVTSPADEAGGTRYVCTGWTGAGSVPASGAANVCVFTITNDSTLTWQWLTEHRLDTEAETGGSVDVADGWYTNGANVHVEANPGAGYGFLRWAGDVPAGQTNQPAIDLVMDRPRSITAHFVLVPTNRQPVVAVASQQIYLESLGDSALLDASPSYDPDGDMLFYSWREGLNNTYRGLVPIGSENMARLRLYFPEPGRYEFIVRVSDGELVSAQTRTITVYVPGLKGVVNYSPSSVVTVPDARISAYLNSTDASLRTNPVDIAITGSFGHYVLENVGPESTTLGRRYYLRIDRPGFNDIGVQSAMVLPDPGFEPGSHDYDVGRGWLATMTGTVTDTNDVGIFATVAIIPAVGGSTHVATAFPPQGRFTFGAIPRGSWLLQLRSDGYQPEVRDINIGGSMWDMHLTMVPAAGTGSLTGRVVNADTGQTVDGATVKLIGVGAQRTSDSLGRYAFHGLPSGTYIITVTKTGYETLRVPSVAVAPGDNPLDFPVFLSEAPVVHGTVTDRETGRAVALATVGVRAGDELLLVSDVTDRSGYYHLESVPPAQQEFVVRAPGYITQTESHLIDGSRPLSFELSRSADWRPGGGVDAGAPEARVAASVLYLDTLLTQATLDASPSVGSNLRFIWREQPANPALNLIPAGSETMEDIDLFIPKPGTYVFEVRVTSGGILSPNTETITVFAPGLSGNVHASPSDGVVGLDRVNVRAYTNYADAVAFSDIGFEDSKQTVNDPIGDFALSGLSTGAYWVAAEADVGTGYLIYGPVRRRVNHSVRARRVQVNMAKDEYELVGHVRDWTDFVTPLENVRIVIAPGSVSESYRTTTDANGYYRLASVPAGQQQVLLMKTGYQAYKYDVYIGGGNPTNDFLLPRNESGALADLSGEITALHRGVPLPVPHAEVVIGAGAFRTFTDSNGRYAITGLPPGFYNGIVRKVGYRTAALGTLGFFSVNAGGNAENKTLEFSEHGAVLRALVMAEDQEAIAGATVTVVEPATRSRAPRPWRMLADDINTGPDGVFQLPDLSAGEHTIRIDLPGGGSVTNSLYVSGNMEAVITLGEPSAVPYAWKSRHFGTNTVPDFDNTDSDGDGDSNWREYVADTMPTNPLSFFDPQAEWTGEDTWQFAISNSSTGRLYDVQWRTDLLSGQWLRIGLNRYGTGADLLMDVTNAPGRDNCFYRSGVRLPD